MSLPNLSGVGRLIEDPELRFAPSGTAVCKMRLAFNSRKKQDDGTWADDKSFFVDATAFGQMAENCAESFTRATDVWVSGRLVTDKWEDRQTGEKRSKPSLLIDDIGPSVRFATATVNKASRSSGGNQSSGGQRGSAAQGGGFANDPWASPQPASTGAGRQSGFDDEVPF